MPEVNNSKDTTYHLYTYSRSACAQRLRIAFNLKSAFLPSVILHHVDMSAGEHLTDSYRAINPSGKIPSLVIESNNAAAKITITQSTAILEYLEEAFPGQSPLLPPQNQALERARVREMIGVVTQDMFPRVNRKTANRVFEIRESLEDQRDFVQTALNEGFDVYEGLLELYGGKYSVGDEITLADVCLAPQVFQAYNWGVDVRGEQTKWPLLKSLMKRLDEIEAFRKETNVE